MTFGDIYQCRMCRCLARGGVHSPLGSTVLAGESITFNDVLEAALVDDALAIRVFRQTASYIGAGVANLWQVLAPPVVVLGGEMMAASKFMLGTIRRECRDRVGPGWNTALSVEVGELGDNAALVGAAGCALNRLAGARGP